MSLQRYKIAKHKVMGSVLLLRPLSMDVDCMWKVRAKNGAEVNVSQKELALDASPLEEECGCPEGRVIRNCLCKCHAWVSPKQKEERVWMCPLCLFETTDRTELGNHIRYLKAQEGKK